MASYFPVIERELPPRGPDPDAGHQRRPRAAEDAQAGQRDVTSERIRDQIHRVAQREQGADAMVLAERGAPGLEERLRRDHQDAHAEGQAIVASVC